MNNLHAISDLGCASYLHCNGYSIEALDRSDPHRVQFCFRRDSGLDESCQAYWSGTARVNPMALLISQKMLKQRLYDAKEEEPP